MLSLPPLCEEVLRLIGEEEQVCWWTGDPGWEAVQDLLEERLVYIVTEWMVNSRWGTQFALTEEGRDYLWRI